MYTFAERRPALAFSLLEGTFHFCHCITWGFIASILGQRGFSLSEVGTVMTLAAVTCTVCTPIWGYLADRTCRLRLLILLNCIFALLTHIVIVATDQKLLIAAMVIVIGATINSVTGLVDSWISRLIAQGSPVNFGVPRSVASASYAVTSALFGVLLTRFGLALPPILLAVGCIPVAAVVLLLPNPKPSGPAESRSSTLSFGAVLRRLCSNKVYLAIVFCYFLGCFSNAAFNTFLPAHIESLGGTQTHLGLALFCMVISDVPIMLLYHRLEARFGCWKLLAIGFGWFGVRNLMLMLTATPELLVALAFPGQLLTAGLIVPSIIRCYDKIIDPRCASSALLFSSAIGNSFAQILSNFIGGFVAEAVGTRAMVLGFTPAAFLGGAIMMVVAIRQSRREAEEL